jgi:hypothetical protein
VVIKENQMPKIPWSSYGKSREELIAAAEARQQLAAEKADRIERYGMTTEERLEGIKAEENFVHPSRPQAKVYIQPSLAGNIERSRELAYWAKNDPGWDSELTRLSNEIQFAYGGAPQIFTHPIDYTSLAQDAYLLGKQGLRSAKQSVR